MATTLFNNIGKLRDKILDKTWKKLVMAGVLTIIVIGSGAFAYIWTNPNLKNYYFASKTEFNNNGLRKVVLSETDLKLLQFNPITTLVKQKSIKELPIYPKSWQKEYFNESELRQLDVSGENADADRDGLTNKEEYMYGSDPKNKDTLGSGGSDGEYVEAKRSPLTGLPLENFDTSFYFLNTDIEILKEMNNDLDLLQDEGINIPKLYQLAQKEDFSNEQGDIKLNIIDNPNRDSSINYLNERLLVIKDIVNSNYITGMSKIYQTKSVEDLQKLKTSNNGRIQTLLAMGVPKPEEGIHKNLVYFFKQVDRLIDLRIEVVEKGLERKDYDQRQNDIVIRTVWAHRQVNNAINNLNPNL